jgi:hypothetical protein
MGICGSKDANDNANDKDNHEQHPSVLRQLRDALASDSSAATRRAELPPRKGTQPDRSATGNLAAAGVSLAG